MRFIIIFFLMGLTAYTVFSQNSPAFTSVEEALKEPEKATALSLKGQGLTTLPEEMERLVHLEVLNLSVNNFHEIPPVVFKLISLKELYISGAYSYIDKYNERGDYLLSAVPSEISKLKNLRILDLSYNQVTSLPTEIGQLAELKQLNLWHNELSVEALRQLKDLQQLEILDVGGNNLSTLPTELSSLKKLYSLSFDNRWAEGVPVGDCLFQLPGVIYTLTQLQSLSLSGQCVEKIGPGIGKLTQLKELNLYANSFLEIPDQLSQLKNLEVLDIGLTCIGEREKICATEFSFPKKIGNLKMLKKLSFSGRVIKQKERDRIKRLFKNVDFAG